MKEVTPDIPSDSSDSSTKKQPDNKRNPIAVICVIVVLGALVFAAWQLAQLIGR